MTESVTLKLNSHARRTNLGEDHNAFLKSGFAMGIQIASTELMKTQPCTIAPLLNHVLMISSLVRMVDA